MEFNIPERAEVVRLTCRWKGSGRPGQETDVRSSPPYSLVTSLLARLKETDRTTEAGREAITDERHAPADKEAPSGHVVGLEQENNRAVNGYFAAEKGTGINAVWGLSSRLRVRPTRQRT